MSKLLDFIKKESSQLCEEKSKIESDVHRMKIDLEMTENTINKICSQSDQTVNVFSVSESVSFNDREVTVLNEQKKDLQSNVEQCINRKKEIEERLCEIDGILEEMHVQRTELENEKQCLLNGKSLSTLDIQEKERQRISRDIHDSVVQNMTVLIHKSEFVMKIIDSDIPRAKLELEVINKVVRECINELRGIIFDLHPMSIDDLGLEITLKRLIQQLNSSTDMIVEFNCNDCGEAIDNVISITILRIIQELCSNSIKYSSGTKISIDVSISDNHIVIVHQDDGVGFNEEFLQKNENGDNTGFGLPMLRERVALLGGSIQSIKNISNEGTKYLIDIPYSL